MAKEPIRYCTKENPCLLPIPPLNPHRIDRQKVWTLELLAKAKHFGDEWLRLDLQAHVTIKGEFTPAPYLAIMHAKRLAWFGLAEVGEHRSGFYRITDYGLQFLLGKATVPEVIYCRKGVVVERDSNQVAVSMVKGVILDKLYWDNYAAEQTYGSPPEGHLF